MANERTGSVEAIAAKAVVGLPTMWRIVTVIGSLASTVILLLGTLAFNMMREEWNELRAEVKEMRHRIDEMPDGATLNRLADDVQDLGKRVGRLETQINNWDE
jgi:outer membrane murein-binding lipoprotein Lpp